MALLHFEREGRMMLLRPYPQLYLIIIDAHYDARSAMRRRQQHHER